MFLSESMGLDFLLPLQGRGKIINKK